MQKKIVSLILFVFLLGLVGYFMMSIAGLSPSAAVPDPIPMTALKEDAKVVVEQGTLILTRDGSQIEITTEALLEVGDSLSQEEGAQSVLYWPDGSMSMMEGESTLNVTSLLFDENTGDTTNTFEVETGEVWTKVMGMITEGSQTTITAKDTVAGIRGTELYHAVNESTVTIGVLKHAVDIALEGNTNPDNEENMMIIPFNQEVRIAQGEATEPTAIDFIERQDMITAWEARVDTYTQNLAQKRRNLLVLPERSLASVVSDHAKAVSESTWSTRVTRNIQDVAAYIAEDMRNDSQETILEKAGILRDLLNSSRTAATTMQQREILLASIHFIAKALLTDIPRTQEYIALRQMIQEQKALLYKDMGDTDAMELLLLRELFFIEDLSNEGSFDEVDVLMESLKQSIMLAPISDTETPVATTIQRVIENMIQLKVANTEDVQRIQKALFPDEDDSEETLTNANTNEEETPAQTTPQSLSTTTPSTTRVNTNTNVPQRTNANTNTRTAIVPVQQTEPTEPVVTPQTTTEEPAPAIQVPNRTVPETVIPEPEEPQTTTRSTISGGR